MSGLEAKLLVTDVLVIGGGGAGLRAAISARRRGADVLLVSKSRAGFGNNTYISKATLAAPRAADTDGDSPKVHLEDTIRAGRGLNDVRLAAIVAERAAEQVRFLEECGARFEKKEGVIRLFHLPGHSHPRHVRGLSQSGRDLILPLLSEALRSGVRILDHVFITRLFVEEGRFAGACGLTSEGGIFAVSAQCAVLATGGFSQIYRNTNNAAGITGDGHVLAYDLGVPLADMEFVQFYPTALGRFGNRIFLYEAIAGRDGAVLRNSEGRDIADLYGMKSPLEMTRDRLARAVMKEILKGRGIDNGVVFDLSRVPKQVKARLKGLMSEKALSDGQALIVRPTAHFCMGGVRIKPNCETACPGIFAAGEVCAGVHGANRLGGNALAEVLVMGEIAGSNAAEEAASAKRVHIRKTLIRGELDRLSTLSFPPRIRKARNALKDLMWNLGGIIRGADGLIKAINLVEGICEERGAGPKSSPLFRALELHNMLLVGQMVLKSALARKESRGAHYSEDFPSEDNAQWLGHVVIENVGGEMRCSFERLGEGASGS